MIAPTYTVAPVTSYFQRSTARWLSFPLSPCFRVQLRHGSSRVLTSYFFVFLNDFFIFHPTAGVGTRCSRRDKPKAHKKDLCPPQQRLLGDSAPFGKQINSKADLGVTLLIKLHSRLRQSTQHWHCGCDLVLVLHLLSVYFL